LENEALEEAWGPWWRRYLWRSSFGSEIICSVTSFYCVVKCLARLNVELGLFDDAVSFHPLFWLALLLTAVFAVAESLQSRISFNSSKPVWSNTPDEDMMVGCAALAPT
jgi:hypothetical protein